LPLCRRNVLREGADAFGCADGLVCFRDDQLENAWHRKVCNGTLTLRQAQKAELAYKRAHG
jgi:hypothetical protein